MWWGAGGENSFKGQKNNTVYPEISKVKVGSVNIYEVPTMGQVLCQKL